MTKDLTLGSPTKLILGFSVPVLFGILFQDLYSIVDTAIVGQFIGVQSLAAVGATGSLHFLIIGCCIGICSGFAIPVAQKFGAKDFTTMRQLIAMSVILSVVVATIVTGLTVLFCRPLLTLMRTPQDIIEQSCSYIRVIFFGIPVIFLYNLSSAFIRAIGDSKTPLYFLTVSLLLNIVLDILFVVTFKWGVAGAAFASVISEGFAGVLCLIYICRKVAVLRLTSDNWKIRPAHFGTLLGMGIPMGLQYSVTAVGSVIVQWSVNRLGSSAVASVAAAMKIHILFCAPFDALGTTMATYGGQNTGALLFSRLSAGVRSCLFICAFYSAAAAAVMYFTGRQMATLFLDASETAICTGVHHYLMINSLFYFPLAAVNVVRFMIQGMGFSRLAIISGVFEMIARASVGIFLVPKFGFIAACFASPSAWVAADLFLFPAFYWCRHRLESGK